MVLKELSKSIKEMAQSSSLDLLVCDMNLAVQDLQDALRSLPSQLQEKAQGQNVATMPLMEVLPVITVASLLTEISVRIEGVVDAVDSLRELAGFKPVSDDKPEKASTSNDETKKTIEVI